MEGELGEISRRRFFRGVGTTLVGVALEAGGGSREGIGVLPEGQRFLTDDDFRPVTVREIGTTDEGLRVFRLEDNCGRLIAYKVEIPLSFWEGGNSLYLSASGENTPIAERFFGTNFLHDWREQEWVRGVYDPLAFYIFDVRAARRCLGLKKGITQALYPNTLVSEVPLLEVRGLSATVFKEEVGTNMEGGTYIEREKVRENSLHL